MTLSHSWRIGKKNFIPHIAMYLCLYAFFFLITIVWYYQHFNKYRLIYECVTTLWWNNGLSTILWWHTKLFIEYKSSERITVSFLFFECHCWLCYRSFHLQYIIEQMATIFSSKKRVKCFYFPRIHYINETG